VLICCIEFAWAFASTPPPTRYLTGKSLEGAIPYVLVNIKLVGAYAVVNLL
jgi:hypothetical protein